MIARRIYLAIDLGAGSGRVIAGEFDSGHLSLSELHRFDNTPLDLPDGWHWNLPQLYQEILNGLKAASAEYGSEVVSLGVDTWGVDYGYLDSGGRLLGLPYQYRDSRTNGMIEEACKLVPKREIYEKTGIDFMFFNTLYQMLAEQREGNRTAKEARYCLFLPDLISYWLSGKMVQERTIASTSQLYDPRARNWDRDLIRRLGLSDQVFGPLSDASTVLGKLRDAVVKSTGLRDTKVVCVPGHDTASAIAAIPSSDATPAYLSSGTWSLMGLELPEPIVTDSSFADGFTNEVGINHTIRFLKNICGLWLVQESRRFWSLRGSDYNYSQMSRMATEAPAFHSLIDPDDPSLATAGKMPEKIAALCEKTGQPTPETPGAVIRCIYESLALKYASVWNDLRKYTETPPSRLHLMGGGSQDRLLNQFTADATGLEVVAGPVEATATGNILSQMLADGIISSLAEGRRIVADSFPSESFHPNETASWKDAKVRFAELLKT